MKTMKNLGILIVLFALTSFTFNTSNDSKGVKTIKVLTSAVCGECKERIEKELNYTKGVVFAELDLETKEVTVKYKTKHLSEKQVKEVIAGIGYDAGETKRNEEAFNKLPKCCQSAGHCSRD
ncbi:heavy-metal-associated domain-containing protein [Crocinitomix algicola]|uniref:heavy-metal-associated domain-containing protein n=1 Tax=Crocinitomix algicola TaxID=1740263 RepID=UPI00083656A2|nr:heavy-metal-associated domain-containing protein [Crocinitomix algicola]